MWDFLWAPLDVERAHLITEPQFWHARLMFLAWAIVAPLAVLVARFFKVLPSQDWPHQLDSQFWWRCHWIGQSLVLVLTVIAAAIIYPSTDSDQNLHGVLGYAVLGLVCVQALLGKFRGTKGGPLRAQPQTKVDEFGDHYNMTPRRRAFELLHKSLGYLTLLVSMMVIMLGYWQVNAPRWMWLLTGLWWCFLILGFVLLQRRCMALDTYQAIWGPEKRHPGNQISSSGWGVTRYSPDGSIAGKEKSPASTPNDETL